MAKHDLSRPGGLPEKLEAMALGERVYLESSLEGYGATQRAVLVPPLRRSQALQGRVFSCSLFTAVGARPLGTVRYLVCVERTA